MDNFGGFSNLGQRDHELPSPAGVKSFIAVQVESFLAEKFGDAYAQAEAFRACTKNCVKG